VLFTSTPGFQNDIRLAEEMKSAKPDLKIAFVGPHVTLNRPRAWLRSPAIDWVGTQGIRLLRVRIRARHGSRAH